MSEMWRKRFFLAVSFLTVIPFPHLGECSSHEIRESTIFFPLVGLLIGFFLLLVNEAFSSFCSPTLTNLFVMLSLFLITGGLHHDGLADTADATFSSKGKDAMLDIMRDSHIGTMGVSALIFSSFFFWQMLNELSQKDKAWALLCSMVVGRCVQVLLADKLPYARSTSGVGSLFTWESLPQGYYSTRFRVAALSIVAVFSMYSMADMPFYSLIILGFTFLWGKFLKNKFGGVTGDCLGASNELAQLLTLLLFVVNK